MLGNQSQKSSELRELAQSSPSTTKPKQLASLLPEASKSSNNMFSVPGLFTIHDNQGLGLKTILEIVDQMLHNTASTEDLSLALEEEAIDAVANSDDLSVFTFFGTEENLPVSHQEEQMSQFNFDPLPLMNEVSYFPVELHQASSCKRELSEYEDFPDTSLVHYYEKIGMGLDSLDISNIFEDECEEESNQEQSCNANLPTDLNNQWQAKFQEMCKYRNRHGNCAVPYNHHENRSLAHWVKRQRYQYKKMLEGRRSAMTTERVRILNAVGFIWDSQTSSWYERLNELNEFKNEFGHCNVPSNYAGNPPLSNWVKGQRRQYRLFHAHQPSAMTLERIQKLEEIGFEWELRPSKRRRVSLSGSES